MPSLFFSLLSTPQKPLALKPFDLTNYWFLGDREYPTFNFAQYTIDPRSATINHHGNIYLLESDGHIYNFSDQLRYPGVETSPLSFGNRRLVNSTNILRNYATANWVDFSINPNGTKLWAAITSGNVFEFNMTNPWDITTLTAQTVGAGNILVSSLSGTYNMDSIGVSLSSCQWVDNGNILLGLFGATLKNFQAETPYNMANIKFRGMNTWYLAAFDSVLTASDSQVSFNQGLAFNNDGTKIYLYNDGSERVIEFATLYPWVTGGGVRRLSHFQVNAEPNVGTNPSYLDIYWGNSGYNWYTVKGANVTVFNVANAYEVNTSTKAYDYDMSIPAWVSNRPSFSVMTFNETGNILYLMSGYHLQYFELSTPWDVRTSRKPLDSQIMYTSRTTPSLKSTDTTGIFVKPDGTRLYAIGTTNDAVFEYKLDPAWSFANARTDLYANVYIGDQETSPQDIFFSNDGQYFYVLGQTGDDITAYFMSSAWDLSTAAFDHTGSIAVADITPTAFYFKPDGTKCYVLGQANDRVAQFTVSPAWDVQSISLDGTFSVSAQEAAATGLDFKDDGTKMYVSATDINEYRLTEAWNVQSAVFLTVFAGNITNHAGGTRFGDNGNLMFVAKTDLVERHILTTPWNANTSQFHGNSTSPNEISRGFFGYYDTGFNQDVFYGMLLDQRTYANVILKTSGSARGTLTSTWSPASSNSHDLRGLIRANSVTTTFASTGQGMKWGDNGALIFTLTSAGDVNRITTVDPYQITPNVASANVYFQGNSTNSNNHTVLNPPQNNPAIHAAFWIDADTDINGRANLVVSEYATSDINGEVPSIVQYHKYQSFSDIPYDLNQLTRNAVDKFDQLRTFTTDYGDAFTVAAFRQTYPVTYSPTGTPFTEDGKTFFILIDNSRYALDKISLTVPYRLSSNTRNSIISGNGYYYIGTHENTITGMHMSADGGNLYVIGTGHGTGAGLGKITQYTMSAPYTINTMTYIRQFAPPDQTFLYDVKFDDTGYRMFTVSGSGTTGNVHQWNLTSPWDISTAVAANRISGLVSVTNSNLAFSNNGTILHVFYTPNGRYIKYNLATAYELNTAAQVQSTAYTSFSTPFTNFEYITLNNDGTKLFVLTNVTTGEENIIRVYNLTTSHDASSTQFNSNVKINLVSRQGLSTGDAFRAMDFDGSGTRFYLSEVERDMLYQFKLI